MMSVSRKLFFAPILSILLSSLLYIRFNPIQANAPNGYPVHNLDTGYNYTTIQEAINSPETLDGHIIFVEEGIYFENVVVNKSVALTGESKESTIIDGNYIGNVVNVTADNVIITGFTIRNSRNTGYDWPRASGIALDIVRHCNISGNILTNNTAGIFIYPAHNSSITRNSIFNNTYGIELVSPSKNNSVSENIVTDNLHGITIYSPSAKNNRITRNYVTNNYLGISLSACKDNVLRDNIMAENKHNFDVFGKLLHHFMNDVDTSNTVNDKPIYYLVNQTNLLVDPAKYPQIGYLALINCDKTTIRDLHLSNNYQGVLLALSNNSLIQNVTITENCDGIVLIHSTNDTISECSILDNYSGLRLEESSNNTIYKNTISNNEEGLFMGDSSYNEIFHNAFIQNKHNIMEVGLMGCFGNSFDYGYPSGGNYWGDYNGTDVYSGPYQNETCSDGIGDTAYSSDTKNTDRYPLMARIHTFDAGAWNGKVYSVDIVSNSTVSKFQLNETEKAINFNVTDPGFCRVTVPNIIVQDLWQNNYTVLLNDEAWPFNNWTDTENTYLYFTYHHPKYQVTIIPEFPLFLILPLLMITMLLKVIISRRLLVKEGNLVR